MQSIVESAPVKRRGNPYRDADGKFCKQSEAVYIVDNEGRLKKISKGGGNPYHDKAGKFAAHSSSVGVDWNSPDGKKLTTITKKWQGQSGQVEAIQKDFLLKAAGKSIGSTQRTEHMRVLKNGIKNSPPNDETLYRGVKMPKGHDIEAMVGQSFIIGPSSFSSDQRIARHFVDRSQTVSTTVVYRMHPGKGRGLKIAEHGDPKYAYEKESISAGQFKMVKAEKLPGNKGWIVDVEHTAMFDWSE